MQGLNRLIEKYTRQYYGISTQKQREYGLSREEAKKYKELAQTLWNKGPEEAMKYINENSDKLNMNIVADMTEGILTLPDELKKKMTGVDEQRTVSRSSRQNGNP